MTKCRVIDRNPLNMVIDFNGKLVQIPSDNGTDKYIFVSYENGSYSIVTKPDNNKTEKIIKKTKKEISTQINNKAVNEKSPAKVDEIVDVIV